MIGAPVTRPSGELYDSTLVYDDVRGVPCVTYIHPEAT